MIRKMEGTEIPECVALIRRAFMTVADAFGFTAENAPRFTAFATTQMRLRWQFEADHRPMYVYVQSGQIVGYYSLALQNDGVCELNNLCVDPARRHAGIGGELLDHAFAQARALGCHTMHIGIVEENQRLRNWYEAAGFVHTGTEKFDFFPFTCGYMQKMI